MASENWLPSRKHPARLWRAGQGLAGGRLSPGGCSGFQYGMALDNVTQDDDQVIEQNGLKLVVDEFSFGYLRGAEIDYVDSLMGAGFTVVNPNAVASCSCGHSFDTADHAGNARRCH